jgi:small subunit ribosomal protein S6
MLKNYELLYILHPDLEGSSDKVSEKVSNFIKKADGEVTNQEDWGKRKLAYKIAKNDFGVYVLVNFTLPSEKLPEIERDLRLSEEIIRFLVVALPEEKEIKEEKPKRAKKTEDKPVEQETETGKEKPAKEEKAVKKPAKKAAEKTEKAPVKVEKKTKKEEAETEKERMKKLDEKLEEILGD